MIEITQYRVAWNAGATEGTLTLDLVDDTVAQVLVDSPEECLLLLDVLRNEKPVYYDAEHQLILTGFEPVGEGED